MKISDSANSQENLQFEERLDMVTLAGFLLKMDQTL